MATLPSRFNQYRGDPPRIQTLIDSAKKAAANAAASAATTLATGITTAKGALQGVASQTAAAVSGTSLPSTPSSTTDSLAIIGQGIAYLFGILIILIIITLIVHYFVTPVYRTKPGAPGLITLPGTDNGVIFWNGSEPYPGVSLINDNDLPISNAYFNYSFIVDIFIQDPMQFSLKPRVILSRAPENQAKPTTTDGITSVITTYNFAIALKPNVTDLIISTVNVNGQPEDIDIKNVPVQIPFRLGVVIMQKVMEIYINGRLMKTKKFEADLADIKGDIRPASGNELNIAKLQNLKIWNSILSTNEIAQANPSMASASSFNATPISSGSSCPVTSLNINTDRITDRISGSIRNVR